jgi:hypothetical protein
MKIKMELEHVEVEGGCFMKKKTCGQCILSGGDDAMCGLAFVDDGGGMVSRDDCKNGYAWVLKAVTKQRDEKDMEEVIK